jgi:thiol-disulfide isomerase/thioredoxin
MSARYSVATTKQVSVGRLLLSAVLLVFVATVVAFSPVKVHAAPRAGQPAPNFKVITTSGQPVVDFFATWCQPCRESIPHLIEMNRKYGKQGLQVLGMSADEDGERLVKAFVDEHRVTYPVALAGESALVDFGVRSVPIMFIIDKKGRVAEVFRGFTDEVGRSSEQLIKKLLAEK